MEGEFFSSCGVKRGPGNMQVNDGMGDANDVKKAKLENTPSKVIYIKSLPNDATDADVVHLGMPFGKVTNVLVLRHKNQAFLEFADESCAVNMVTCYKINPAQIRLKSCYVEFSTHKELKTDLSNNVQVALQGAQGLQGASNGAAQGGLGEQTSILRVIVDKLLYPVTLEVLHQLFSRYGKILKIITFSKNNIFQALIQFGDRISAVAAKDSLDNQNIYNGCNTLKIEFSRMTNLNVKYNNDRSRDFTRNDLPTGDGIGNDIGLMTQTDMGFGGMGGAGVLGSGANALMGGLGGLGGGAFNLGGNMMGNMAGQFNNRTENNPGMNQPTAGSPCILVSNLDEERVTPDALFTLFGVYGNVHRVKILYNKKDNALIQMADSSQAMQAITYLDKVRVWGKQLRVGSSKHQMIQLPKEGQSVSDSLNSAT
ncbi:hypothetical protein EGW08_007542 [Elysia chlorotica]|uniref:RRM domain-containing protein n=1 Tax=Elysia chlorotica TaxID=188477 RepID=A0A433TT29_ELYCH|nr:hypothetical protein EGW08_007542 [Elysia chlorotica]